MRSVKLFVSVDARAITILMRVEIYLRRVPVARLSPLLFRDENRNLRDLESLILMIIGIYTSKRKVKDVLIFLEIIISVFEV